MSEHLLNTTNDLLHQLSNSAAVCPQDGDEGVDSDVQVETSDEESRSFE